MSKNEEDFAVKDDERKKINGTAAAKYGGQLKPGERLDIDLFRDADHATVTFVLAESDNLFRVELEAAILDEDEHPQPPTPADRLYIALDFVDAMFEDFLDTQREGRFHEDWRVYDFENALVRFRGVVSSPSIEALADSWLATQGEPGEVD